MVFKINGIDFSNNILIGTYEVNKKASFVSWQNANYRNIRIKTSEKVAGEFEIFFKSAEDYQAFKNAVDSSEKDDMTHIMILSVNNSNKDEIIEGYIDYVLVRDTDGNKNDFYQKFKVTIEEA